MMPNSVDTVEQLSLMTPEVKCGDKIHLPRHKSNGIIKFVEVIYLNPFLQNLISF
jgi:hypothetical protein